MYKRIPHTGIENPKAKYWHGITKPQCINICESIDDCGAILWQSDEYKKDKCYIVKMISNNVINDTQYEYLLNMDLYLKGNVIGVNECADGSLCNDGSCEDMIAGFKCLCPPGKDGNYCEIDCSFGVGDVNFGILHPTTSFNDSAMYEANGDITQMTFELDMDGYITSIGIQYGSEIAQHGNDWAVMEIETVTLDSGEYINTVEVQLNPTDPFVMYMRLTSNTADVYTVASDPDPNSAQYSVVTGERLLYVTGNTRWPLNNKLVYLNFVFESCS